MQLPVRLCHREQHFRRLLKHKYGKRIESLSWLAAYCSGDDTVLTSDLKDEPQGGAKLDISSDHGFTEALLLCTQ
jgi:hypothetical protein